MYLCRMWKGILMEFNTYEYVAPEFKSVYATEEYAAQYWYQQGWMACRLFVMAQKKADEAGAFRV